MTAPSEPDRCAFVVVSIFDGKKYPCDGLEKYHTPKTGHAFVPPRSERT